MTSGIVLMCQVFKAAEAYFLLAEAKLRWNIGTESVKSLYEKGIRLSIKNELAYKGSLGGISDGSSIILRAAIKPTPSISQPQKTVNTAGENIEIAISGRHDPVIVPRAVVVVESMAAITLTDLLMQNMTSRIEYLKNIYL